MTLNTPQKRYIKKHIQRESISSIANRLGISIEEIQAYIVNNPYMQKYSQGISSDFKESVHFTENFNLKKWVVTNRWYLLVLTGLVFLSYVNALGNGFVSDDRGFAINLPVWDAHRLFTDPYPFLRMLLYLVTYKIFGLNEFLFRTPNIIFHTGVVLLIYLILSLMQKPKIGLLAGALFAVHPILVESVTWISGGVYVQYSFFFLMSLFFYMWTQNTWKYLLSLVFFILALLSSEKAVVLALIFPLYELSFGNLIKNWKRLLPYFIITGFWVLLYLRLIILRAGLFEGQQSIDPTVVNPLLQVPVAITSYLQLIFWPDGLTIYHTELLFTNAEFIIRAIITGLFIAIILYCFKRSRDIFFWLTFFWVTLIITLNPFVHAWIVAERYVYLGTAGILVVVAMFIERVGRNPKRKTATYIIFSFIILSLMIRTVVRNTDWQSEDTLWPATGRTSPSSPQNHNNLGDYYGRHGDVKTAVKEFQTAIALKPNYADAYHNLGNAYRDLGDIENATASYEKALTIEPRLWQSYQNIAALYYAQGNSQKAIEELQKGLTVDPQNANLYIVLAVVYYKQGEKDKAIEAILNAIKFDPKNAIARQAYMQIQNGTLE